MGGQGADTLPVAAQRQLPDKDALQCGQGDKHGANRVAPVVAVRPGQPGDGQGQIRAGEDADAMAMARATGADTAP